ncbi:hypothetical protein FB451DRAFT_1416819 [Mycena latifolia]|nr:hypothetical protein FB451DRAFT_1416819 [Mycena latifolia]
MFVYRPAALKSESCPWDFYIGMRDGGREEGSTAWWTVPLCSAPHFSGCMLPKWVCLSRTTPHLQLPALELSPTVFGIVSRRWGASTPSPLLSIGSPAPGFAFDNPSRLSPSSSAPVFFAHVSDIHQLADHAAATTEHRDSLTSTHNSYLTSSTEDSACVVHSTSEERAPHRHIHNLRTSPSPMSASRPSTPDPLVVASLTACPSAIPIRAVPGSAVKLAIGLADPAPRRHYTPTSLFFR